MSAPNTVRPVAAATSGSVYVRCCRDPERSSFLARAAVALSMQAARNYGSVSSSIPLKNPPPAVPRNRAKSLSDYVSAPDFVASREFPNALSEFGGVAVVLSRRLRFGRPLSLKFLGPSRP